MKMRPGEGVVIAPRDPLRPARPSCGAYRTTLAAHHALLGRVSVEDLNSRNSLLPGWPTDPLKLALCARRGPGAVRRRACCGLFRSDAGRPRSVEAGRADLVGEVGVAGRKPRVPHAERAVTAPDGARSMHPACLRPIPGPLQRGPVAVPGDTVG